MIFAVFLVIALMIMLNALYVAGEFATVNARRSRVSELADDGNRLAAALLPILVDRQLLDRYIAACQIGITLSSLIVGYYGQAQLTPVVAPLLERLGLSPQAAVSITVPGLLLLLTFLQVILGELVPKSISLRFPERTAMALVQPMRVSLVLLRPLIAVLNGSAHLILQRFGRAGMEESHVHHPDELEAIFKESADGGLIDAGEREMLTRVFNLDERVARQIMVPRPRVVAAPLDSDPAELLAQLIRTNHTRFPVYGENIDDIRGMVHLRELYELVMERPQEPLSAIVHPIPILPEFLSVTDVWARVRKQNTSIAAIFDEYGGVVGIVTIEDVLEELFGELQDEFDDEEELFREDDRGDLILRGDVLIEDVNERFLLTLPDDAADTIGGLVMDELERTAQPGDEVEVAGMRLEVLEVDGLAVTRVRLTAPVEGAEEGVGNPADPVDAGEGGRGK